MSSPVAEVFWAQMPSEHVPVQDLRRREHARVCGREYGLLHIDQPRRCDRTLGEPYQNELLAFRGSCRWTTGLARLQGVSALWYVLDERLVRAECGAIAPRRC